VRTTGLNALYSSHEQYGNWNGYGNGDGDGYGKVDWRDGGMKGWGGIRIEGNKDRRMG
jgi:hypothetical protein